MSKAQIEESIAENAVAAEETYAEAEVEAAADTQQDDQLSDYKPHKIFINNVDSFNSKYIAAYISDQIYGASKIGPTGPDEGQEGEEAVVANQPLEINIPTDKYEFIGTLTKSFKTKTEDISFTVSESSDDFLEEIMKCGIIIYDISWNAAEIPKALTTLSQIVKEFEKVQEIGPKTFEKFNEKKVFILISTVMTWALTKPLDRNDPDLPFSEVDYKKRRPHPNYREHYTCEKEVIKIGQIFKDKLKTYVVCSGLTYGEEEEDLLYFFKMAWYNEVLPIFNNGTNMIPLIHIRDLAKSIHGLIENTPSKPQYILSVEQTPSSLKQIIKSLSKALGDNQVINVVAEEAFLYKDMTQNIFEKFTVNLNMEPVFLVENLQIEWLNEAPLPENMLQIVKDFKTCRKLNPVKLIIHGPPGVGKLKFATMLSEYYNLKLITVDSMLSDFLKQWRQDLLNKESRPPKIEEELLGEEEFLEEEAEEEEDPQQIMDNIREIEIYLESGVDKIPDEYVVNLMKQFLAKNLCQNRGYVLVNYPQTIEQAKELFGQAGGPEEEEEEATPDNLQKILPDAVISLVATDDFVLKRNYSKPEDLIKGTPYEEDPFVNSLEEFRRVNTEDNTVLNFFDELEIDILLLDMMEEFCREAALQIVIDKYGPPAGFGLTLEEEEELRRIEEEQKRLALEKELLEKQLLEEQALKQQRDKMEGWAETLERLQKEEEKLLVAQSEPLRHYLMKYVFPILTKGLIMLAKVKPCDPIDFLAEFLFKQNPEAKMFDPSFTEECDTLYAEFRKEIEKLIEGDAFGDSTTNEG